MKKPKRTSEKGTSLRTKEEAKNDLGKGFAKGIKPEDVKAKIFKVLDRRVAVDSKGTKVEVFQGDTRTDEQVIQDYKSKYNK